jgi:oligoendopeptidase F
MKNGLPTDPIEFSEWDWDQIAPHANGLLRRRLTLSSIDEWLADWSALARLIAESFNRLYIRTTTHTNDRANHARFRKYSEEVMPKAREFEQRMKTRLLESGLRPKGMAVPLRRMRSDSAIYRPENLPLRTKCEALEAEYNELTGSRTFDWDGEKVDQAQVFGKLGDLDRGVRERAWRAIAACLESQRTETDRIWVQLLDLRQQMARNAGFKDYRSFHWRELARFDYTPQDCRVFHDGIAWVVIPAVQRLAEKRKRGLSLDTLRIWDDFWHLRPDPLGRLPLKPFKSAAELTTIAERVFTGVDPELAAYYRILRDEGLLDLEARAHKAPVGYMCELPASKRAFIFTVAVGLHLDVDTHLHESGHAFHVFESAGWPCHYQSMQDYNPVEFVELGSMAMELLGSPYLGMDRGGFYTESQLAQARLEHLEQLLEFWPYMAVVDAFQHWVYENPDAAHDTRQCDEVWASLQRVFRPHIDWTGLEDTLRVSWRLQDHIMTVPFYYVEYGMAQLGAVGVWANALKDQAGAVKAYRKALSLGNTTSLPDLYKAAGVKFAFGATDLRRAVELIESAIAEIERGR